MNSDYKIEKISCGEVDKIAELYKICFGREAIAGLFKWKYSDNPAGEILLSAVKFNGAIVGFCVMIPENFHIFGEKKLIYKCADLMVHPCHRRKGLSTDLVLFLCENLKKSGRLFLYTLCSKNATHSFLKNKWSKSGNIYNYFKHNRQIKAELLFTRPEMLHKKGILRPINSVLDLCRDYKINVNEDRVNIVKDEKYLKWRLSDPRHKYNIIGYYDDEALKGYAVYSLGNNNIAYIIDIETFKGSDQKIGSALLSAIELSALKAGQRALIGLAAEGSAFQEMVKKNRYIRNPFQKGPLSSILDFNILVDEAYGARARDRANWDIRPINYDGI
jgi:hypothetical protein